MKDIWHLSLLWICSSVSENERLILILKKITTFIDKMRYFPFYQINQRGQEVCFMYILSKYLKVFILSDVNVRFYAL